SERDGRIRTVQFHRRSIRLPEGAVFRARQPGRPRCSNGKVLTFMRHLIRLWVVGLLALTLALPVVAREEISAFIADVTLRTDGSVLVSETVDVNAEGIDIRRGIYRDIPIVQLSS